jgi:hypothetical protein
VAESFQRPAGIFPIKSVEMLAAVLHAHSATAADTSCSVRSPGAAASRRNVPDMAMVVAVGSAVNQISSSFGDQALTKISWLTGRSYGYAVRQRSFLARGQQPLPNASAPDASNHCGSTEALLFASPSPSSPGTTLRLRAGRKTG